MNQNATTPAASHRASGTTPNRHADCSLDARHAQEQYRRHTVYVSYLEIWRRLANQRFSDAVNRGDLALSCTAERECRLVAILQSGFTPALLDHLPEYRETAALHRQKLQIAARLHRAIFIVNQEGFIS